MQIFRDNIKDLIDVKELEIEIAFADFKHRMIIIDIKSLLLKKIFIEKLKKSELHQWLNDGSASFSTNEVEELRKFINKYYE